MDTGAFVSHFGELQDPRQSAKVTPALLSLLEVKGCLISIDAMGCQTAIAKQIVEGGSDYLLAIKGNQPALHEAVKQALSGALVTPLLCYEKGHVRYEARAYHVMDAHAHALSKPFPEWAGLRNIGVALGYRKVKAATTASNIATTSAPWQKTNARYIGLMVYKCSRALGKWR